jgi:Caspase domain
MYNRFLDSLFLKLFKNGAVKLMMLVMLGTLLSSKCYVNNDTLPKAAARTETKARLFLITVIDSEDEIIGERCQVDEEEITAAFTEFSEWLDIAIVFPKTINGNQFSKASVNDAINNWLPSFNLNEKDIVVFYYSGHGFRLPEDKSVYPRMWLKTASNKDIEPNSLRMEEDIYDRIVTMGAGVNIVISDCCNSVPGANTAFATTAKPKKSTPPSADKIEGNIKDFEQLFSPGHPLSIIATASDATELAGGTAEVGGFFTLNLLEALDKSIYEDEMEPTWENVLNYAKDEAAKKALGGACPQNKHNANGRCIQTAKFTIRQAAE